jgi:hypothetical protein
MKPDLLANERAFINCLLRNSHEYWDAKDLIRVDMLTDDAHRGIAGSDIEREPRFLGTRRLVRLTAWWATSSSHASSTTQFAGTGLGDTSVDLSRKLRGFRDPSGLCARLWPQKYRQRALSLHRKFPFQAERQRQVR